MSHLPQAHGFETLFCNGIRDAERLDNPFSLILFGFQHAKKKNKCKEKTWSIKRTSKSE